MNLPAVCTENMLYVQVYLVPYTAPEPGSRGHALTDVLTVRAHASRCACPVRGYT